MKTWTQEKVFHDGDRFFSDVVQSIRNAKKSVSIEVYIFELDALGNRILSLLQKISRQGIEVCLLIDGFGSLPWDESDLEALRSHGIHVRVYHPIPQWMLRLLLPWNLWRLFQWGRWVKVIGKLNRRNHRKVFLIDQEIAYVGGFNITSSHLREFSGNRTWRDSGVRVEGSAVKELADAFQRVWETSQRNRRRLKIPFRNQKVSLHPLVKLNDSWSQRRQYHQEVLRKIAQAKERIWITNPYFVPDFFFLRALRLSAWSGVDVRILLPKRNDIFLMQLANRASYRILLKAGVRIFEYLPSTLHAKILLVDQWVTLGSSNRNHRSLIHDLEVDVVLTRSKSLQSIEDQYLKDLSQSEEIHFSRWINRAGVHLWLEKLVLSFKNWL
jgi:cardiolipin synthase